MKRVDLLLMMLVIVFVSASCASTKRASREEEVHSFGSYEEKYVNTRFEDVETAHKQVYDMNRDKVVDLWKYYAIKQASDEEEGKLVLLRKEFDANFDGRVDTILYYNDKEELIREEIDVDFDGFVEFIRYYSGRVISKIEYFTTDNSRYVIDQRGSNPGLPNVTKQYRHGVMTREEIDENLDTHLEVVKVYDAQGRLLQVGEDTTHDGQIDTWTRY